MSNFDPAIAVVLAHEGGWLSREDDPVGGETNFGISELIIGREKLSSKDLGVDPATASQPGWLKAMTVGTATALYRKLFWERYGYVRIIAQTPASKLFDAAVNMGPERAHKLAQAAAGIAPEQQDGVMGIISCGSINLMDPGDFVRSFTVQLSAYYRAIAAKRPPDYAARWLPVWLKRAAWPNQPAPGGI